MAATLKLGDRKWATKEGSLLAYNDENNNIKPLPFDFTRASSATRVNKQGLIETVASGVPRIDYTDANGALLLEPQRSNLVTYSEDATNWSTQNSSVLATSNQAISPDGTLNADKLIPASGSVTSNGGRYIAYTSTISTDYSISVFVKQGEYRYVTFSFGSASADGFHFDLQDGVIVSEFTNVSQYTGLEKVVESFANGWYRLKISVTDDVGASRFIAVRPANELPTAQNNNYATTGDGTSGIYVYGLQLESNSSYATSYIPTQGSAVTRIGDACSGAGNDQVINSTEGVLFIESAALANDATWRILSLTDGTSNNKVHIAYKDTSNTISAQYRISNVPIIDFTYVVPSITTNLKIAFKYSLNNFSLWINGVKVKESFTGSVLAPNTLNKLDFNVGSGALYFFANLQNLMVFPSALSDTELAALTTI